MPWHGRRGPKTTQHPLYRALHRAAHSSGPQGGQRGQGLWSTGYTLEGLNQCPLWFPSIFCSAQSWRDSVCPRSQPASGKYSLGTRKGAQGRKGWRSGPFFRTPRASDDRRKRTAVEVKGTREGSCRLRELTHSTCLLCPPHPNMLWTHVLTPPRALPLEAEKCKSVRFGCKTATAGSMQWVPWQASCPGLAAGAQGHTLSLRYPT